MLRVLAARSISRGVARSRLPVASVFSNGNAFSLSNSSQLMFSAHAISGQRFMSSSPSSTSPPLPEGAMAALNASDVVVQTPITSNLDLSSIDVSTGGDLTSAVAAADPLSLHLGYSPTDLLVRLILNIHEMAGLPWWGSILAATVLLRVAITPLNISMRRNAARMTIAQPKIVEYQDRFKLNPPKNRDDQLRMAQEWKDIQEKYSFKFSRSLVPLVIQLPLFITFFLAIRKLTTHYPSMKTGGIYWFTDLTIADPYYILPLITSGVLIATIEFAPEPPSTVNKQQAEFQKKFMRFVGFASFPATMSFETSFLVYWLTNNVITFGQNTTFQNKAVQRALGIPEIPKDFVPAVSATQSKSFFSQIEEMTKQPTQTSPANAAQGSHSPPTSAAAPSQVKLQDQFQNEMREARHRRSRKRTN